MIRAGSGRVGMIQVAPGRVAIIRAPAGRVAMIRVAPGHVGMIRLATPNVAVIRLVGLAIALTLAVAGTALIGAGALREGNPVSSAPLPPGPVPTASDSAPTASDSAPTASGPVPTASWSAAPDQPAALGRSVPVRLDIPAIGVHTGLMRLALRSDGTVAIPPLSRDAPAGWYQDSVTPGEAGPAVILGHVDSARSGPAVFYRLGSLRPGDRITVRRADGSTAAFTVTAAARYAKNHFPTADVYGRLPYPGLRLITCGGVFDRSRGSYRDNIVIFARGLATPPRSA
jgi:hypothetical protein